jgi:hypothetical protein
MAAQTGLPRAQRRPRTSSAIGLILVAFAVLASSGPFLLRSRAAVLCDMAERMGGAMLTASGLLLLVVNLAVAAALWGLFRNQGGLGVAGALVVGFTVFAIIATAYLWLTAVPAGYPTPPWSCPRGRPAWWPDLLPG